MYNYSFTLQATSGNNSFDRIRWFNVKTRLVNQCSGSNVVHEMVLLVRSGMIRANLTNIPLGSCTAYEDPGFTSKDFTVSAK